MGVRVRVGVMGRFGVSVGVRVRVRVRVGLRVRVASRLGLGLSLGLGQVSQPEARFTDERHWHGAHPSGSAGKLMKAAKPSSHCALNLSQMTPALSSGSTRSRASLPLFCSCRCLQRERPSLRRRRTSRDSVPSTGATCGAASLRRNPASLTAPRLTDETDGGRLCGRAAFRFQPGAEREARVVDAKRRHLRSRTSLTKPRL